MNSVTGKKILGMEHLRQSIGLILTTPLGSRVMRRDFGSRLFSLLDSPMNRGGVVELYVATAEALRRWEPRFKLKRVSARVDANGKTELDLEGDYLPTGESLKLEGLSL